MAGYIHLRSGVGFALDGSCFSLIVDSTMECLESGDGQVAEEIRLGQLTNILHISDLPAEGLASFLRATRRACERFVTTHPSRQTHPEYFANIKVIWENIIRAAENDPRLTEAK